METAKEFKARIARELSLGLPQTQEEFEAAWLRELYCSQNEGDCKSCSLVNYGLDCHNNPIPH